MTEAEALSELRGFPVSCLDFKEQMALDMAINALEKQIAKMPLKESQCSANAFNGWYLWKCPSCNHQLGVVNRPNMSAYCGDCGHKLGWSEV